MKRLMDVAIAVFGLIALAPVIIIVAAAVRLHFGRPILFRQLRAGFHGCLFHVCKFRTMNSATNPDGTLASDAQRLTPLGKMIRSWSLDELPQLWNVLIGDMSLVGPRPLLSEYLDRYNAFQARRHEVRPGLTGWAQVNGRNTITWEEKFALDVWYVDNRSFRLDLVILYRTFWQVVSRRGISRQGHATMLPFEGNRRPCKRRRPGQLSYPAGRAQCRRNGQEERIPCGSRYDGLSLGQHMDQRPKILIVGASGHAKVIIDIVEQQGTYEIAGLIDSFREPGMQNNGVYGHRQ